MDRSSDCRQNTYCNLKSCGFSLRGSPHYFQCKACQVLSFRTLNNIVNMHYFGPYGNRKDMKVNAFVGVPLLKLSVNNSTLCGADHVRSSLGKADIRSRQESRPTTLNIVKKEKNRLFNRNTGFVVNDTSCVDLPEQKPIDVNDPVAYLHAVSAIRHSGVANYRGARIPLQSSFNWEYLQQNIDGYHDKKLLDYIKFVFPLGLNDLPDIKVNAQSNHSSATFHPQAVDQYIDLELEHGALLGPFRDPPHPAFTWSPLMTRPKGEGRRVILDLSYGSNSVNKNTHTGQYDNTLFTLKLPNLDSLLPQLECLDQDARLFKVDISRAFRNVRVDPGDAVHLGMYWNNQYFLDKNLAFGAIHGTAIFQRITDFVRYLMAQRGFIVNNYIDDIYAVVHKDSADLAFETLKEILGNIGLPLKESKVFAPCTNLTIMGIAVDIHTRTFSIPHEKLLEIVQSCVQMFLRDRFMKQELQSLLGRLLYVSRCVPGSRGFLNRILNLLRENHAQRHIIPNEKDLLWFIRFLQSFNGVVTFKRSPIQEHVFVDATLTGLGGVWGSHAYTARIPDHLLNRYSITQYEMYNIVVALWTWGYMWKDRVVLVSCDNQSAVHVCQSGKTKDPFLDRCFHALWLHAALFNIDLRVTHVSGRVNQVADALSRHKYQGAGLQYWEAATYNIAYECYFQFSRGFSPG